MRCACASIRSKPVAWAFSAAASKRLVGFGKIVLARPGGGALQSVGQAVRAGVRMLHGLFVFHPRLRLVAHQRIGVSQAQLRIVEMQDRFSAPPGSARARHRSCPTCAGFRHTNPGDWAEWAAPRRSAPSLRRLWDTRGFERSNRPDHSAPADNSCRWRAPRSSVFCACS